MFPKSKSFRELGVVNFLEIDEVETNGLDATVDALRPSLIKGGRDSLSCRHVFLAWPCVLMVFTLHFSPSCVSNTSSLLSLISTSTVNHCHIMALEMVLRIDRGWKNLLFSPANAMRYGAWLPWSRLTRPWGHRLRDKKVFISFHHKTTQHYMVKYLYILWSSVITHNFAPQDPVYVEPIWHMVKLFSGDGDIYANNNNTSNPKAKQAINISKYIYKPYISF